MGIERRVAEASGLRQLFQEQWEHIHHLLSERAARQQADRRQQEEELHAMEALVDGTNPQVKLVFRYKDQLRSGVRSLLEHVDSLVESLPAPINASPEFFFKDPRAAAIFGTRDRTQDTLRRSTELQRHFNDPRHAGESSACGILFMRRLAKQASGVPMKGTPEPPSMFTEHTITLVDTDEARVRSGLKEHLFNIVVEFLNCRLTRLRAERQSARMAHASDLNHPAIYLEHLSKILRTPLDLLDLEANLIHIDRKGFRSDEPIDSATGDLTVHEMRLGHLPYDVLTLVICPRIQIHHSKDRPTKAEALP